MMRRRLAVWVLGTLLVLGLSPGGSGNAQAQAKAAVLSVTPTEGLTVSGPEGGPFTPSSRDYTVNNGGDGSLTWGASANQPWVTVTTVPFGEGMVLVIGSAAATSGTVDISLSLLRGTGATDADSPASVSATVTYDTDVLDFQSSTSASLLSQWYEKSLATGESTQGRINVVVTGLGHNPDTDQPFVISTFDNQREGGNASAQQNPFPLGTLRFAVVGAAGASTAITAEDLTLVDASVQPQIIDSSAQAGVFTVGSGTPNMLTGSGVARVALNAGAQALQGSGAGTTYNATVTFTSNGGTTTRAVALTVIDTCVAPAAPAGVQASDGTYPDRVRVTWPAVSGATQYRVFRGEGNDPAMATELSPWISVTSFDDTTAAPPSSGGGCSGGTSPHYYNYWVKARNDCGTSDFSALNQGYRGSARKAAESGIVREEALPAAGGDGLVKTARPDSRLFVRLTSDEPLAPGSPWGTVESQAGGAAVAWLPAGPGGSSDGWLVFEPEGVWLPGEVVTVRAGAKGRSGSPVGPVTQQFRIDAGTGANETALWQPAYGADFDAQGLDLTGEGNGEVAVTVPAEGAVPPFAEAVGAPVRLGPDGVFETPQRVWLPVPEGEDPNGLVLYYYHAGGSNAGWYRAEQVDGWLVPSSELQLEVNGVVYRGVTVRYGAVVQLGRPQATGVPTSASILPAGNGLRGVLGDALVFGLAALALWAWGKRPRPAPAKVRR